MYQLTDVMLQRLPGLWLVAILVSWSLLPGERFPRRHLALLSRRQSEPEMLGFADTLSVLESRSGKGPV